VRADEYKILEGCLAEMLGELRSEYVERMIAAIKADEVGIGLDAGRVIVLDDVIGTIAARAADTVPQQPETESASASSARWRNDVIGTIAARAADTVPQQPETESDE